MIENNPYFYTEAGIKEHKNMCARESISGGHEGVFIATIKAPNLDEAKKFMKNDSDGEFKLIGVRAETVKSHRFEALYISRLYVFNYFIR